MRIPTNNNPLLPMNTIEEVINANQIISLGEIIPIVNMKHVNVDLLSGIYTTKSIKSFDLYQVIEIEYEAYDSLMGTSSINQKSKATQNNVINTYFIEGKGVTQYEIIKFNTNIKDVFPLPKYLFKNISNHMIPQQDFCSIMKCYLPTYKQIKEAIIIKNHSCISILSSPRSGIAYMLTRISDKLGYIFFKKEINHFISGNQMLTYLKKKEFSSPCVILFPNVSATKWLSEYDTINQLKQILSIKRTMNTSSTLNRIVFIFQFQYESTIPAPLQKLFQNQIILKDLSPENKQTLINCGIDNIVRHSEVILQNNKPLLLNMTLVIKQTNSFKIAINPSIEKVLISLSIKDIKAAIKLFFIQLLNDKSKGIYDQILLNVVKTVKSQKLNQDETLVNTIPEIKWKDIGGLDSLKEEINDIINLPMKYPHIFNSNIT